MPKILGQVFNMLCIKNSLEVKYNIQYKHQKRKKNVPLILAPETCCLYDDMQVQLHKIYS